MEALSSWITSISSVTIIMAIVCALIPKNAAGRICTMIGSLLLMIVLVSPVCKPDIARLESEGEKYTRQIEKKIESVEEMENDIIERKLCAYVYERMEDIECDCEIEFVCSEKNVEEVIVSKVNEDEKRRIREILSEMGVEEERLKFRQEVKNE